MKPPRLWYLWLLLACWLAAGPVVSADDVVGVAVLVPDAGVYVNYFQPDAGFSGSDVAFQVADIQNEFGLYCPTVTKTIYLRFNLTDVTFPIDKARLRLRPIGDTTGNDIHWLTVTADDWEPETVTYNAQPALEPPFIIDVDRDLDVNGDFVWFDHASGGFSPPLQQVLADRQSVNGGDDWVSLGFVVALPPGCSDTGTPPDPDGGIFFRGIDSTSPPLLELADASNALPGPSPAAVRWAGSASVGAGPSAPGLLFVLWLALWAGTVVAVGRDGAWQRVWRGVRRRGVGLISRSAVCYTWRTLRIRQDSDWEE